MGGADPSACVRRRSSRVGGCCGVRSSVPDRRRRCERVHLAGSRLDRLALRLTMGTSPFGHRHRRARRNAHRGLCIGTSRVRGLDGRLRADRRRPTRWRPLDRVRPRFEHRRLEWPNGRAGPDDRVGRVYRPLHWRSRPLRGQGQRFRRRPDGVSLDEARSDLPGGPATTLARCATRGTPGSARAERSGWSCGSCEIAR
jgi:hypothetical protein